MTTQWGTTPETFELVSSVEVQQALVMARSSLLAYTKLMFPKFKAFRHHFLLADIMERVARGELKRVIINLPPRHSKSILCTEHFPPWMMGQNPSSQLVSGSYNQDLADNFGRKVQSQVLSPLYRAIFPNVRFNEDTVGLSRWETTERGCYNAVGVGAGLLGKGGNCIIIDDPYKNLEEAESEAIQRRVIEWYQNIVETRQQMDLGNEREDGMDAAIVVIHQRWNDNDLTAWLLENRAYENWTHIVLSAECEDPETDILGREKGEPLWPEAYGKAFLERMKRGGDYRFASMYQQNPMPKGGRIFKEDWFADRYEVLPTEKQVIVHSWDTAGKEKKSNDPTAFGDWRVVGRKIYLAEAKRERAEYPRLKEWAINEIMTKHPHFVLIEDRNSGQGLIQELMALQGEGRVRACTIVAIQPGQLDKRTRAIISSSTPQNRAVVLPKQALWLGDYLREILRFPSSKRDDYVDMSSQAWTWIREHLFNTGKIEVAERHLDLIGATGFHSIMSSMKAGRMFHGRP